MQKKYLDAFNISKSGDRNYWTKIGVGFINKDGSINVRLHSIPVGGEFQLREPRKKDSKDSE